VEQDVALRVVADALAEAETQELAFQIHELGTEDALVHQHRTWTVNDRRKAHVREDVVFDVDAGRDLAKQESSLGQLEHAAFGDVVDLLAALGGVAAAERDLFDAAHELLLAAFAQNRQAAVLHSDLQPVGSKGSGEDDAARVLADVDEAPGPGQ